MNDIDTLFAQLTELQQQKKRPPVHLWQPDSVGEIDIRIDAEGRWYHEGSEFKRQPLVNLFSGILRREEETYYLVTPVEKLRIEVADVPFIAIDMDVRGSGQQAELMFTTNVEDYVLADAEHPLSMHNEMPYLKVRDELYARLSRPVFYRLVEQGVQEAGALCVYSAGARFNLGPLQ